MINRICFYGGPGCGKSTTAHDLFSLLKREGFHVEFSDEKIKGFVYQNQVPTDEQQLELFVRQIRDEANYLDQVKQSPVVVCESSLLTYWYYANRANGAYRKQILDMALSWEARYNGLHIFIERPNMRFSELGRWHDYEESLEIDDEIRAMLVACKEIKDRLIIHGFQSVSI